MCELQAVKEVSANLLTEVGDGWKDQKYIYNIGFKTW